MARLPVISVLLVATDSPVKDDGQRDRVSSLKGGQPMAQEHIDQIIAILPQLSAEFLESLAVELQYELLHAPRPREPEPRLLAFQACVGT